MVQLDLRELRLRLSLRGVAIAGAVLVILIVGVWVYIGQVRDQGVRRSAALAELAQAANARSDFERGARYALLGLDGADRPMFGFEPVAAESALRDALAGSQRLKPPMALPASSHASFFSPDGAQIATVLDDNSVQVTDAATGVAINEPIEVGAPIQSGAFSNDGRWLAVGDTGASGYELKLFDLLEGEQLGDALIGTGAEARKIVFSPDDNQIAVIFGNTDGGGFDLWDFATDNKRIFGSGVAGPDSVAFAPDGKQIATATPAGVEVWDTESLTPLLPAITTGGTPGSGTYTVAFAPDGTRLAIGTSDGHVLMYSLAQNAMTFDGTTDAPVHAVRFSGDGLAVAAVIGDGTTRILSFPPEDGRPDRQSVIHRGGAVAFSPDGAQLTTVNDGVIDIWSKAPLAADAALAGQALVAAVCDRVLPGALSKLAADDLAAAPDLGLTGPVDACKRP